jgi:Uma2 family endonuclease
MSQPAPQPWTVDTFFDWQERQEDRYELVNGFPLRLMAGARNVHNLIVINLLGELRTRLRGSGCWPFNGDCSVRTGPDRIRRPDVGVSCGKLDPDGLLAPDPRLIAEVLSPSARDFDTFEKVEEYKGIPGLHYVLVIEPNAPQVSLWAREDDEGWRRLTFETLADTVELPHLGLSLRLADIYEGVDFPPRPRLVSGE